MKTIDKSTVKEFNLQRYLGKWYEIARYDHRFERGLHYVTAEYSKRPDGKIKVLNCGHQDAVDGKEKCSIGKARPSHNGQPGQLQVAFFLSFYSDYNILELDPDYQWSLIGRQIPVDFKPYSSSRPKYPKPNSGKGPATRIRHFPSDFSPTARIITAELFSLFRDHFRDLFFLSIIEDTPHFL